MRTMDMEYATCNEGKGVPNPIAPATTIKDIVISMGADTDNLRQRLEKISNEIGCSVSEGKVNEENLNSLNSALCNIGTTIQECNVMACRIADILGI